MTTFPKNLPRWNQRQKKRQRLQRVSGVVLLAASAGGAAFWGNRLWPARGTGWVVCVLLAAVPLALWLLLDCPPRREQRPEELAVFNMDKATPGSVVLLAVTLFFWLYLPEGMIRTENGSLQLEGWLAESLLGFVFMGLAVYMLVAFRNEVLFVAPDGSVECWNVLGQHRLVEERAAMVRIRPLLGRSYVCDAAGNVLYHFDRGMINTEPLLDWLQSQGVANTGTEMRRQIADPWPRVLSVLDWDEADRTPGPPDNALAAPGCLAAAGDVSDPVVVTGTRNGRNGPAAGFAAGLLVAAGLFRAVFRLAADLCVESIP